MSTAHDLYKHILNFLDRGTIPGSAEAPQDLRVATTAQTAPDWRSVKMLKNLSDGLLPTCTLGKGERSPHAKLHAYLDNLTHAGGRIYQVISEFPFQSSDETIDSLVLDSAGNPVAAIELKHYSAHQGRLFGGLLAKAKMSLDADFIKCNGRPIHYPVLSTLVTELPLIQVGLYTAIHDCGSSPPPLATAGGLWFHSVNFVNRYVCKPFNVAATKSTGTAVFPPLLRHPKTSSFKRYGAAQGEAFTWFNQRRSRYAQGHFGWGPAEKYSISGAGRPNDLPVTGRVGYICVMT